MRTELDQMRSALMTLDRQDVPLDIGAHLQSAIDRLEATIDEASDSHAADQAAPRSTGVEPD